MNYKYSPAKHATQKFTVKGVDAYFYATNEKTMQAFLKKRNARNRKTLFRKSTINY